MTTINSTYISACASGLQQGFVQSATQIGLRRRWQKLGPFDGIYSAINAVGHCIAEMGKHFQGIESSSFMSTGIDLGVDLATRPLTTLLHKRFFSAAATQLQLQITNEVLEIKKLFKDLEADPGTFKSFLGDEKNKIQGQYKIQPFVKQLDIEFEPFKKSKIQPGNTKYYDDCFVKYRNDLFNRAKGSVNVVSDGKLGTIEVVPDPIVKRFQFYLPQFHQIAKEGAAYWEGIQSKINQLLIPIEDRISTYKRIHRLLSRDDVHHFQQKNDALDKFFTAPPSTLNSLIINSISSVFAGFFIDASTRNIPAGNISAPFDADQAICTPDQQPAVNTSNATYNATHELPPDFSNECNTSQQLTAEPNPWNAPETIMASALIVSGVWLACLAAIQLATNQELNDKERKKRTLQVVGGCGLACTGIGAFYASI